MFVRPADLGLTGVETADRVDGDPELLSRIESIRAHAAVRIGLARSASEATERSPGVPKIAFVTGPADYAASDGRVVAGSQIDLVGRIMTMGRLHRAYALTGGICSGGRGADRRDARERSITGRRSRRAHGADRPPIRCHRGGGGRAPQRRHVERGEGHFAEDGATAHGGRGPHPGSGVAAGSPAG
jgi:hypothetical protein